MKLRIEGTRAIVTREPGDPRAQTESILLYKIRDLLLAQGKDVIKKLMYKDGHMTAESQHYVRSRKLGRPGAFAIWHERYAIEDAAEEFNKRGEVVFAYEDMSQKRGRSA